MLAISITPRRLAPARGFLFPYLFALISLNMSLLRPKCLCLLVLAFSTLARTTLAAEGKYAVFDQMLYNTVSNLAQIRGVSLQATNSLFFTEKVIPGTSTRAGTYSYMAYSNMYVIRNINTGSTSNVIKSWEVSFDGSLYSWYDGSNKYMLQSQKDQPTDPVSLQNPLFANIELLSPDSETCPACQLRMDTIREIVDKRRLPKPIATSQTTNDNVVVAYTGNKIDGSNSRWEVMLNPKDEQFKPLSITHIIEGDAIAKYTLLEYTNINLPNIDANATTTKALPLLIPVLIDYRVTAPNGDLMITGLTRVLKIDFPESIDKSHFRLDDTPAKVIYNSDDRKLTRSPPHTKHVVFSVLFLIVALAPIAVIIVNRWKQRNHRK